MGTRIGWARRSSYGALVATAIVLGTVAPAHAATSTQISGDTQFQVSAVARTTKTSFTTKQKLGARAIISYRAEFLGLPVPLTAVYINSIPTNFGKPVVTEVKIADLDSWTYKTMRDPWLNTNQWIVKGMKGFWGKLTVEIRGDAVAKTKGSKYFHAGSGVGNAVDANSALLLTIK